jgi:predicted ATPase
MGQAHVASLSLTRLAQRETAALVGGVAGGKSLPPEILDRIVRYTDGVPLFIEELTKNLLEGGLLREEAGGYALAIPSSLQDAPMARLVRLSGAKQVAQTAAIIGREFSYELLRAVTSISEDELQSALRRLVESELIFQRGNPPQMLSFGEPFLKAAVMTWLQRASLLKPCWPWRSSMASRRTEA